MSNLNDSAVRNAAQQLREAQAQQQRIAERLAQAQQAVPPEPDLTGLERAVQDASADHAIGAADAAPLEAAQRALAEARQAAAKITAERAELRGTIEGLQRRLDAADGAVLAAEEALHAATVDWLLAESARLEADYLVAAEQLSSTMSRFFDCTRAMGRRGVQLPNVYTLSVPVVLPVCGTQSAARYMQATTNEQHPVGKNLAEALMTRADAVESQLAALQEPPKRAPGLVGALKRAVGV